MTILELANQWLTCPETVAIRSKAGTKCYSEDAIEQTNRLLAEGKLNGTEIGKITGLSSVSVSRYKKKLNLR